MLFDPEINERGWKPGAANQRAVNAGMASGTKGNQKGSVLDSGPPMVDMKTRLGFSLLAFPLAVFRASADLALATIASENAFTETAKIITGVGAGPVAGAAEIAHGRDVPTARTKQRTLRLDPAGVCQFGNHLFP